MSAEHVNPHDSPMQRALTEIEGLIRERYPSATFRVARGEDPEGVYLRATVDVEDTDEVVDAFIDRLLEVQIDEGLPLYVIPLRPPHRVAAMLRAATADRGPSSHRSVLDLRSTTGQP